MIENAKVEGIEECLELERKKNTYSRSSYLQSLRCLSCQSIWKIYLYTIHCMSYNAICIKVLQAKIQNH